MTGQTITAEQAAEIDTNILTCTCSMALRSDHTPEQRAEALRIGRIGFATAGAGGNTSRHGTSCAGTKCRNLQILKI